MVKVVRWDVDDTSLTLFTIAISRVTIADVGFMLFQIVQPTTGEVLNTKFNMRDASYLRSIGELAALFAKKGYLNQELLSSYVTQLNKNCFALGYYGVTGFALMPGA
ncbi:hypothetical protein [Serratia marcescens]|uniref:hypothetical protein n=1 Tax=Serratia marcescens TaxID=615 RepID=UPI0034D4B792